MTEEQMVARCKYCWIKVVPIDPKAGTEDAQLVVGKGEPPTMKHVAREFSCGRGALRESDIEYVLATDT